MNRARLLTFDSLLRNLRSEIPEIVYFDLERWITLRVNNLTRNAVKLKRGHGCGTAACALGAATLFEPFQKEGLVMMYDVPCFNDLTGVHAGAAFFGISRNQARWLFLSTFYHPDFDPDRHDMHGWWESTKRKITPEMVADRVKQILDGTAPEFRR